MWEVTGANLDWGIQWRLYWRSEVNCGSTWIWYTVVVGEGGTWTTGRSDRTSGVVSDINSLNSDLDFCRITF